MFLINRTSSVDVRFSARTMAAASSDKPSSTEDKSETSPKEVLPWSGYDEWLQGAKFLDSIHIDGRKIIVDDWDDCRDGRSYGSYDLQIGSGGRINLVSALTHLFHNILADFIESKSGERVSKNLIKWFHLTGGIVESRPGDCRMSVFCSF